MVKGVSRRVIVVASPDKRYFDEAIFILRSDFPMSEYPGAAVDQAQYIAARCLARYRRKSCVPLPPLSAVPALLWMLLGAAIMGVLWVLTTL